MSLCCSEGGKLLEFSEGGDGVVFGNAVQKYMSNSEVHLSSCVRFLSIHLGAIDGCNPA